VFQAKLGDTEIDGHPDFHPGKIELRTAGGERVPITADTGQEEIERRFGPLKLDSSYPAFPVLNVEVDGVWLAFEFGSDGRLRILDIEPDSRAGP
jgi:hypothetical protein